MNKRNILLFLFLFLLITSHAQRHILPVKVFQQQQNQWCWAAVSQAVLDLYGVQVSQCNIAEYARTVITWHNFGTDHCCQNPGGRCNYWNYNWGHRGSIQDILVHFGSLNNTGIGSALSHSRVVDELRLVRPFIIRWGWANGGGHFIVGYGIDGQTLHYMDPWFGEGAKLASYDWVVNRPGVHAWTHTNVMSRSANIPSSISISEESREATGVKIYPNPSDGQINVAVSENSIVRLFDLSGRQIGEHVVNARSELKLNQSAGVYFIHVESNGKTSVHKVIVQ